MDMPNKHMRCKYAKLVSTITSFTCNVNDAIFLNGMDAIVTGSDDRSLCIWMKRTSEKFWPTCTKELCSPVHSIIHDPALKRLFVGLDNGTVVEFKISDDLNHLDHVRDYLSHMQRVTGLANSGAMKWIVSTSTDKTVAWYSTESGKRLAVYQLEAAGTCMEYDLQSNYVFVGDSTGRIVLLCVDSRVADSEVRMIRELCGHNQAVSSLSWDGENSRLFSGSSDNSVIIWDIGGSKGIAYELQGHTREVTSVCWWSGGNSKDHATRSVLSELPGLLVSGGLDTLLFFWLMDRSRTQTPNWSESDMCMLCSAPFFWNLRRMWDLKSTGVRQHHCRRCGKAVCDKCSMSRSTLPAMGYEVRVRMCTVCAPCISDADRRSLAIQQPVHHAVTRVRIEPGLKLLLTVGKDRIIKVWDVEAMS